MSFGQSVSYCFKNYANFNGRAPRSEFWWFWLFVLIVNIVVSAVFGGILGFDSTGGTLLIALIGIAFLIPLYAAGSRRLHDTGKSGWLQLLILIPCVGPIILIVLWAQAGQPVDNQYGPAIS